MDPKTKVRHSEWDAGGIWTVTLHHSDTVNRDIKALGQFMIDCSIKYSLSDRGNTWEKMSSLLFQFYVFQKQGQYVLCLRNIKYFVVNRRMTSNHWFNIILFSIKGRFGSKKRGQKSFFLLKMQCVLYWFSKQKWCKLMSGVFTLKLYRG